MQAGRLQEVASGQVDTIQYRFLIDGEPDTPSAVSVKIESPGGDELVATTALVGPFADGLITYSRTWDADDYPPTRALADVLPEGTAPKLNRNFGFRATWTITSSGSQVYTRYTYFEPVLRHFLSQLNDDDLVELFPQLKDQLDDPSNGTFAAWRNKAWEKIARLVERETGRHPGDTFAPEEFFECHRQWTLKEFFFTIARREGDIFWDRFKEAKSEAEREYRLVMGSLSMDEDRNSKYKPKERSRRRWQSVGR